MNAIAKTDIGDTYVTCDTGAKRETYAQFFTISVIIRQTHSTLETQYVRLFQLCNLSSHYDC